jgi:hypothetical protein
MKRTLQALTGVIALYAVVRGLAELFLIDYGDPSSYREDWGGPSLLGVLAVHAGPGLAVLVSAFVWLRRHRRQA